MPGKKKARAKMAPVIDHAAGHKQALQDVKAAGWKVAKQTAPTSKGGGLIRAKHPACKHPNESVDIFTGIKGESVGVIPKSDHTQKRRYRGNILSPESIKPLLTKWGKIHTKQGTIMRRSEESSFAKRKDELANKIETAAGPGRKHPTPSKVVEHMHDHLHDAFPEVHGVTGGPGSNKTARREGHPGVKAVQGLSKKEFMKRWNDAGKAAHKTITED